MERVSLSQIMRIWIGAEAPTGQVRLLPKRMWRTTAIMEDGRPTGQIVLCAWERDGYAEHVLVQPPVQA